MPDQGDVDDQVFNSMQVWLELDDRGLACLIYRYEDSRTILMNRLRPALQEAKLKFAELKLPVIKPVAEVIAWLKSSLDSHPHTILFLSGWETALPPGPSRADAIRQINFQREALALHPVQQIWCFTEHFELDFVSSAPDFYSWFETKWRLLDTPKHQISAHLTGQTTQTVRLAGGENVSTNRQEDARKKVAILKERILEAKKRKLPLSTQLEIFNSAMMILRHAFLLREAKKILAYAMPSPETLLKTKNSSSALSLYYLGDIALSMLDYPKAISRFSEARLHFQCLGSIHGEANCIKALGNIALVRSNLEGTRAKYEEALTLYRQTGDVLGEANCIFGLGDIELRRSNHKTARAMFEEAQPMYRKVNSVLGEANCILSLANIALASSDHNRSKARYEEARLIYRKSGDVLGEANCIQGFGNLSLILNDFESAKKAFGQAINMYINVGDIEGEAECLRGFGDIEVQLGDIPDAKLSYEKSFALLTRIQNPLYIGEIHQRLARIADSEEQKQLHVTAAREAWNSIGFDHLAAELDAEFGK